jgi:hypothetical protein
MNAKTEEELIREYDECKKQTQNTENITPEQARNLTQIEECIRACSDNKIAILKRKHILNVIDDTRTRLYDTDFVVDKAQATYIPHEIYIKVLDNIRFALHNFSEELNSSPKSYSANRKMLNREDFSQLVLQLKKTVDLLNSNTQINYVDIVAAIESFEKEVRTLP